ncbi:uncharacterized protein LOC116253425 [Nymphaea colorata]|nr:uncharacterized protein LOC116253425 [Nymphaea colorata]
MASSLTSMSSLLWSRLALPWVLRLWKEWPSTRRSSSLVLVATRSWAVPSGCGRLRAARGVFDGISEKDAATRTPMLAGYVENARTCKTILLPFIGKHTSSPISSEGARTGGHQCYER